MAFPRPGGQLCLSPRKVQNGLVLLTVLKGALGLMGRAKHSHPATIATGQCLCPAALSAQNFRADESNNRFCHWVLTVA